MKQPTFADVLRVYNARWPGVLDKPVYEFLEAWRVADPSNAATIRRLAAAVEKLSEAYNELWPPQEE